MPNEHIEWFKRFSACYLMYANSNFDRIVKEVIAKDKKAEEERRKDVRYDDIRNLLSQSNKYIEELDKHLDFYESVVWGTAKLPAGTILKFWSSNTWRTQGGQLE